MAGFDVAINGRFWGGHRGRDEWIRVPVNGLVSVDIERTLVISRSAAPAFLNEEFHFGGRILSDNAHSSELCGIS